MISKKVIVKTNVGYSDDFTKRYFLDVCWDKSLPIATVIMNNPSESNGVYYDNTVNNALKLVYNSGYGQCYFLNLFCKFDDTKNDYPENWEYFNECIRKSNSVMLFCGKASGIDTVDVFKKLANLLKNFKEANKKLQYYVAIDESGNLCMTTIPGKKLLEKTYAEILELLGEK